MFNTVNTTQPFPLISSKVKTVIGSETGNIFENYAKSLTHNGYAIIKINPLMRKHIRFIQNEFHSFDKGVKEEFSFVKNTDGFMPLGITFARDEEKTDLSETFNYWHKYKKLHSEHIFSNELFYKTISICEFEFFKIAHSILHEVVGQYQYTHPLDIRDDSYVQFNIYPDAMKRSSRINLQDQHEDGHLITLIKPNGPGLTINLNGLDHIVNLEADEAIVISGSLLTELTDGEIQPIYHSVLDLNLPSSRASLIYNVNVLYETIPSIRGRDIPMRDIANRHHMEFGQHPYHSQTSGEAPAT